MEAKNDQSMRAIRKRNTAMKLASDSSATDTPVLPGSAKQLKIRERNWKNSRKSRSGHKRGLPKKGGAGGKGVWGKLGSELSEETEDENDPNYDPQSEDDRNVQLTVIIPELSRERFQSKGEGIIFEYFQHGNTHEAESAFEEILTSIPFRYWIVELAVDLALDHKPSHCELISVLISDLYGSILNHEDIAKGFDALLSNINELKLDVPEIEMYMGNFIVRAIADDCLAPRFVDDAKLKYASNQIATDTLTRCANMINVENCYAHMDDVWGVAGICGQRPVNFVIRQMVLIIKEYIEANDCNDALERLRQLEVPHFHHEFVYEAVLMAIESLKNDDRAAISRLLKHFENAGILTPDHLDKGFGRVFNDMPDICLDIPLAYVTLEQFVSVCQKDGFLSDAIIKRLPNKGRKRYVSEGDGGKLKNEIPLSQ